MCVSLRDRAVGFAEAPAFRRVFTLRASIPDASVADVLVKLTLFVRVESASLEGECRPGWP